MKSESEIITITEENIADHPGTICFINPEHECYPEKVHWLNVRFSEGLKIKLLYLETEKRPVGFVEYVPGDWSWCAVNARG